MTRKLEKRSMFGASFRKLSMLFTPDANSAAFTSTIEHDDSGPSRRTLVFFGTGDSGKTVLTQRVILGIQPSLEPNISPENSREKIIDTILDEAKFVLALLEEKGSKHEDLYNSTVSMRQADGKRNFSEFAELVLQIASLPGIEAVQENYLKFRQPKPRRFLQISEKLKQYQGRFADWIPSTSEILLNVPATTGMSPSFCISENKDLVELYDVGGSRSERKKWRIIMKKLKETALENTCVLFFTVSLADFDAPLFEKMSLKRLEDSLIAFQDTLGNVDIPFRKVFLVFTKRDLLGESLSNTKTLAYLRALGYNGNSENDFLTWIEKYFLDTIEDTLHSRGDDFVRCRNIDCFNEKSCTDFVDEVYNELL